MKKLFLIAVILFPNILFAQYHGSDLTFHKIQGGSTPTYEFSLDLYGPLNHPFEDSVALYGLTGNTPQWVEKSDSSIVCGGSKRMTYNIEHTFGSTGTYYVSFEDSSGTFDGVNALGMDSIYWSSCKVVTNDLMQFGNDSSVKFEEKAYISGQKGDTINWSPSVENPDGDSLVFDLVELDTAPSYWMPSGISFNQQSGEFIWKAPDSVGDFVFSVLVMEHDSQGNSVGWVQRNFTVQVVDTLTPSSRGFEEISGWQLNSNGYHERRLSPGEDMNLTLRYHDDLADSVELEAIGEPFMSSSSPLYFTSGNDTAVNGSFSWTPDASDSRNWPYLLTFQGRSFPACFYRYKTVLIYVENPTGVVEKGVTNLDLEIHPNPVDQYLIVVNSGQGVLIGDYKVYNASGKVQARGEFGGMKKRVKVGNLAPGYYHLLIRTNKGRVIKRRFLKR